MKNLSSLGLFAVLTAVVLMAPAAAWAVVTPDPSVPWGDAVADIGASVVPPVKATLTLVIMGVLLKYSGPFGMLIRQNYVSDLVGRAVDFAYAATAGAQRGKVLDVSVLPDFMKNVVLYANGNFPWILRFVIKNVRGLVEMALARIVHEVPAEFKYTPAFSTQIEHETGGITRKFAPVSQALARVGLAGA